MDLAARQLPEEPRVDRSEKKVAVFGRLARAFPRLVACDCEAEAVRLGNPRLANTILVGMLSRDLPFSGETWRAAIERSVKPAFLAANLAAFDFGRALQPDAPPSAT